MAELQDTLAVRLPLSPPRQLLHCVADEPIYDVKQARYLQSERVQIGRLKTARDA